MEYIIKTWKIGDLYRIYKKGKLNLSPSYQRNFIWSLNDQQTLIDSIGRKKPIPMFFILQKGIDDFEMVDGQQRSRTIINFIDGGFKDFAGKLYSKEVHKDFTNFPLPVTIINDVKNEEITDFYALVNKSGIHLNKPEIRRADFYETNLLKLVNELASLSGVKSLNIFTDSTLKRLNDVEFISELVVLLKDGNVDKKGSLDEYFEEDWTLDTCNEIKQKFLQILDKVLNLDKVYKINKTRYKQKNDFYTLFDFINTYSPYNLGELIYFYKILVLIAKDIKPTQSNSHVLKDYAINCVTQSNSKAARQRRVSILKSLFLNKKPTPNQSQADILQFYNYNKKQLCKVVNYYTIDINQLKELTEISFLDEN
jgi:hypothetical protein